MPPWFPESAFPSAAARFGSLEAVFFTVFVGVANVIYLACLTTYLRYTIHTWLEAVTFLPKMARKTIRMTILDALDDLVDPELSKFCSQLLDREDKRIKASYVMGKTRVEITSVLIQSYTEQDASKVVSETLRDIGFEPKAINFEKAIRNLTKSKGAAAGASDAGDEMDSEDPAVSFIRGRKVKLITCLGANGLILQFAQQHNVITDGDYREITSISSKDGAMTKLIDMVMDKGPVFCRRFLQVLKEDEVVEQYPSLEEIMKDWN